MLAWTITLVQLTSAASAPDQADLFSRPLGLPLLEARLQDVEGVLGHATVRDEDAFVCYVAPTKDVFLRFVLDRWGAERRIGGFTMRELSGAAAAPCTLLPAVVEARARLSVGGLSLSMSRFEAIRLRGPGPPSSHALLLRVLGCGLKLLSRSGSKPRGILADDRSGVAGDGGPVYSWRGHFRRYTLRRPGYSQPREQADGLAPSNDALQLTGGEGGARPGDIAPRASSLTAARS